MADSLNIYLNTIGSHNIFVPDVIIEEDDNDVVDDYDFVSSTYDPVIETSDEDGNVEIEDETNEEGDDSTPLQNLWSGSKTIVGGTIVSSLKVIPDSTVGFWKNAGTGIFSAVKGIYTSTAAMVSGLASGIKTYYNQTATGIGQIFKGRIGKGLTSLGKGLWGLGKETTMGLVKGVKNAVKGGVDLIKGVAKGVAEVGKSVAKGVVDGVKAVAKGIKKIFKGW